MENLKFMIKWTEKEVKFVDVYTRKIDREFNKILFTGVETKTNAQWEANFNIDPSNIQLANDYLVVELTNLTNDELDNLSVSDYEKILKLAQDLKNPSK